MTFNIRQSKKVELPQNIDKEIIIINDCSTDNTKNAIDQYISLNQNSTFNIMSTVSIQEKDLQFILESIMLKENI